MKLENQACTLKQAKEFDELGLKLESYFVWDTGASQARLIPRHNLEIPGILYPKSIAAYSCAELGVLLPSYDLLYYQFDFQRMGNRYRIEYENPSKSTHHEFISHYEAHAKADLLIHLLKERVKESGNSISLKKLTLEENDR